MKNDPEYDRDRYKPVPQISPLDQYLINSRQYQMQQQAFSQQQMNGEANLYYPFFENYNQNVRNPADFFNPSSSYRKKCLNLFIIFH